MYLFFDTETTGLPKNWKAPITDFNNWPRLVQLAFLTFDKDGNYPLNSRHAAIYESHDKGGINVIDQWNSKGKATRRKISMKNGSIRSVDDADWYYVVETK